MKIIVMIICCILLFSCDPISYSTYRVINNSQDTIVIVWFSHIIPSNKDSVIYTTICFPKSESEFYGSWIADVSGPEYDCIYREGQLWIPENRITITI